jgi:hypothetical protein
MPSDAFEIGDPIQVAELFEQRDRTPLSYCAVTMTAHSKPGIVTHMTGIITRQEASQKHFFSSHAALTGACEAVFSDRTVDNRQRFNVRDPDKITLTLHEPSLFSVRPGAGRGVPGAVLDADGADDHRYLATLTFDSWGGGQMAVVLKDDGFFLTGSASTRGEPHTIFCFTFRLARGLR